MRLIRKLRRPIAPLEHAGAQVAQFRSVARSHEGAVRALNEDRFVDAPHAGVWAVADGMGGHHAGDIAAQLAVDALAALVASGSAPPAPGDVRDAIDGVNLELLARAACVGSEGTSGTTLVTMLADRGQYTCLWVGDSRAYVLRDNQLLPISRDHSLVQEMVDAGVLSAAEARAHPRSNVITRAVGVADPVQLEGASGRILPGDIFLLCSDGLTGALAENEIEYFLASCPLTAAADAMIAAALANRARDNVTFVLIEAKA